MKRELTTKDHEKIVRAIGAEDRVEAINVYMTATESNLGEAQDFVKSLAQEVASMLPEQLSRQPSKGSFFGLFRRGKRR
jgi:hypothetical protein